MQCIYHTLLLESLGGLCKNAGLQSMDLVILLTKTTYLAP